MPAACYGHADVGCLHIRPIINVKTARGRRDAAVDRARGLRPGRRVRRRDERRARRRPGPQPLERKLFGPEVYAAFEAVKRGFDPDNLLNPGKVVGDADPGDNLRIGPDYHPHEPASTVLDFSGAGGVRRRRRDVLGRRRLPQDRPAARCAPATWSPATRCTRPAAAPTLLRLVMTGELPRATGLANETLHEALDLCLQCKACKTECPSNVDMAKLKAEVLHQHYQGRPRPLGASADGPHLPAQPDRLGDRPAGQLRRSRSRAFKWLLEKVAGIDRRRTLPTFAATTSAAGFAATRPTPRRAARGRSCCSTTASRPTTTPEVGHRGGAGARGGRLPGRAGGAAVLRPAGDLEGAACRSARDLARRERSQARCRMLAQGRRSSAASRAAC